jgi:hypothetical protein
MQAQMDQAANQTQKGALLRRFGYGVPQLNRASLSSFNDATIVSEDSLRPLRLQGSEVKTKDMKLHLGDHSKAATYDRFKTGHFAGLRHTL